MNKKFIKLIAVAVLFATALVMAYTFYMAYFNDYKILVKINEYHEANFEGFFLVPMVLILGSYLVYEEFRELK